MAAPLRAMSYNVRHAALDEDEDWTAHRREGVAATIRVRRPDVVALQEAGPTQLGDIAEHVPGYRWRGAGERTGEYNPIGYRTDRLDLVDLEVRWLSETPDAATTGWDAAFPRVATVARLADRCGGDVTLLSVHLDNQGETAAAESARLLRRWVAAVDGPVILAGDLNGPPDGPAYDILTDGDTPRRLNDARVVATHGHHGPDATFTGYDPPPSGPRLDYLLVSDDVDVIQHATCTDLDPAGRFPSDHLPVVADLRAEPTSGSGRGG